MKKNIDLGLLILRLTLGILMLFYGIAKCIHGIRFRTRLTTLGFAFNMLVALLLAHSNDIFALNQHGGWAVELIGLFLFGSLALFFTGSGKYAISQKHQWD